jgi:hypothetical protein
LRHWRIESGTEVFTRRPNISSLSADAALIYRGNGWLGSRWREIACWEQGGDLRLHIEGLDELVVGPDRQSLIRTINPADDPALLEEVVLGPGLMLLLAYQDVFFLHASAIFVDGCLCAFLGESGQGKSTLAKDAKPGWQRIGDDLLPVSLENSTMQARPHFPQFKLEPTAQYPLTCPAYIPLQRIYLLTPEEPDSDCGLSAEPLTTTEATLALIRHTVAAKLFPGQLLHRHLLFAAKASSRVPMYRLRYPKALVWLPRLRAFIRAHGVSVVRPASGALP